MECYKIIYIERPNKRLDIIQFLFFSTKLIVRENRKRKLKEFRFEEADKSVVEAKFQHIMKTKKRIGYQITNEIHDPKYYNLFNKYNKRFHGLFLDKDVKYYDSSFKDMDGDYFLKYTTHRPQSYSRQLYPDFKPFADLVAQLSYYSFGVKFHQFSFDLRYRFAFNIFMVNVRWSNDEPFDKMNCTLTRSVLKRIAKQEGLPEKILRERIIFLSKGYVAYADTVTGKIYVVEQYDPSFHDGGWAEWLNTFPNLLSFMEYVWICMEEMSFDTLYRNLHEDNEVDA